METDAFSNLNILASLVMSSEIEPRRLMIYERGDVGFEVRGVEEWEIYLILYFLVWIKIPILYTLHCPDLVNMVSARMTRQFHKVWDEAEVQHVIKEAMKKMDK